jgi:hypothetical protein
MMQILIQITINYDPQTTELTAGQHIDALDSVLRGAIGNGMLTAHEPQAEIDSYDIECRASQL